MNLKTRLFGQKVEGEALGRLIDSADSIRTVPLEKGYVGTDFHGKCSFTPCADGLNFELYLTSRVVPIDRDQDINVGRHRIVSAKGKIPYGGKK